MTPAATTVLFAIGAGVILAASVAVLTIRLGVQDLLAATAMGCFLLAAGAILGRRAVPVTGLVFSVPLHIVHHLTYIPDHVGVSNGLTIELTDFFALWLLIEHWYAVWKGIAKPLPHYFAVLLPVALMLGADILSFYSSSDVAMTAYGLFSHIKVAIIFLALVLTFIQGEFEIRAACLGLVLGALTIGAICIGETVVGANLVANDKVESMIEYSMFRAAGLTTPTLAAAYLVAAIPLVSVDAVTSRGFRKVLGIVALLLSVGGLTCTLTRAALGILLVGSGPLLVYFYRRGIIGIRYVVLCAVLGLLALGILGSRIRDRLDEGGENLAERAGLINTALNMSSLHPLTGVGLNTYELHMYQSIPRDQTQDFVYLVHNEFALTFAETGPLGVVALLWLLVGAAIRALRIIPVAPAFGLGLLCSLIIVVLEMNVESAQGGPIFFSEWILAALGAAIWLQQPRRAYRVWPLSHAPPVDFAIRP